MSVAAQARKQFTCLLTGLFDSMLIYAQKPSAVFGSKSIIAIS